MSLKRIGIYADSADLELIRATAARRGAPAAAIIREGIHLAAIGDRVRDGSLDWPSVEGPGETVSSASE